MTRQAFILAAGKGERMRPLTDTCPKPLLTVHGAPLLAHILDHLDALPDLERVVVNAAYLGDEIAAFLSRQSRRYALHLSMEPEPLETGGALTYAQDLLMPDAPLLCISGDSYWRTPKLLPEFCAAYDPARDDFFIGLQDAKTMVGGIGDYDVVDGRPRRNLTKSGTHIFTSIRILKPHLFWDKPKTKWGQLSLMDAAEKADRLGAHIMTGWEHLSTPQDIERVNADA